MRKELQEHRIRQDKLGAYIVSTVRGQWPLAQSGTYETMVFTDEGGRWLQSPLYPPRTSLTKKEALGAHAALRREIRNGLRGAKRENREEYRIFPPAKAA